MPFRPTPSTAHNAPTTPAKEAVAGAGDDIRYATLTLPLTAALCRAGVAGLSMSTPGHRGGRLFSAWQSVGSSKTQ